MFPGGVDFIPMSSPVEVEFSTGSERICVVASTIADSVVESEQTFTVLLSTAQERVTLSRNTTLVTIVDENGN